MKSVIILEIVNPRQLTISFLSIGTSFDSFPKRGTFFNELTFIKNRESLLRRGLHNL
jgi:hypothetical protein